MHQPDRTVVAGVNLEVERPTGGEEGGQDGGEENIYGW